MVNWGPRSLDFMKAPGFVPTSSRAHFPLWTWNTPSCLDKRKRNALTRHTSMNQPLAGHLDSTILIYSLP